MINPTSTRHGRVVFRRAGAAVVVAAGLTLSATSVVTAVPASPGQAVSAPTGSLGRGSTGEDVVRLQQALINVGFAIPGGADGVFGRHTENAVRDFQEAQGYKITGSTNPATLKALGLSASSTSGSAAPAPSGLAGMGKGARGGAVKVLQRALAGAGITVPGGADGVFGVGTENAVKAFQQSRGLPVNGTLDDPTARALGLNGYPTPSSPAPTPAPAPSVQGLQLGARGSAVVELQRAIIRLGWSLRGGADGIFGTATQARVRQFQEANGLPVTGVVDSRTASVLGLTGSAAPAPAPAPSPSGTGVTADGFARFDERGARVIALQQALINAGLTFPGGADGHFGSGTAGAVVSFQRARGINASGKVDSATAAALGLSAMPAPESVPPIAVALEAKPVQAPCDYRDTWQAARSSGRVHLGTDIIAAEGRQLYAVATGRITQVYVDAPGALAGNGIKITKPDNTYFFYGHMQALAPGIQVGTEVTAGQLVGWVGRTGNTGTPHLHLEIHPSGGAAVNPYPAIRAIGAC